MNYDISKSHYESLIRALKYNQNIVASESSPLAFELEKKLIKEFANEMGYPSNSWEILHQEE